MMLLTIKIERKDIAFTLTRNFKVHLHWDRAEIMPWYYVMILGVIYSVFFRNICQSVKGPYEHTFLP